MPYRFNKSLPPSIKRSLPSAAQTIFRKTVNNALKEYGDDKKAFRTAWSAVKKSGYKKDSYDKWSK